MNQRIPPLDPAQTAGKVKETLAGVQRKLGMTPNMMRTMAHSPAVLDAYLAFSGALATGVLPAAIREQLALMVGQTNKCEYCVSAHSMLGGLAGLGPQQLADARRQRSTDPKAQAALSLAANIVERRGDVTDAQLAAARQAGLGDAEIAEVVAHVALNVLTNYFNQVARTEVDFPRVSLSL